jgi:hypothetical protein
MPTSAQPTANRRKALNEPRTKVPDGAAATAARLGGETITKPELHAVDAY